MTGPPPGALGRAPFVIAFAIGVLATLYGIATGRLALAAGMFLTTSLSVLYLARAETAVQLLVLYWPFHEILYLFAEGERIGADEYAAARQAYRQSGGPKNAF